MRKKDLPVILVVIIVSALVSFFVSKYIFVTPKNRQQQVDVVQPISSNFNSPDPQYYNSQSIDPTQNLTVGPNSNQNPFSNAAQ